MKKAFILVALMATVQIARAQDEIQKNVNAFTRISVSPKINLILEKGDKESVRIVYSNVSAENIKVETTAKTVKIYLDEARIVDKRKKVYSDDESYSRISMYHDANVTAYVTYRDLKEIEMRGEEELVCNSEINADKFKLKVYGSAEVTLASVKADKFKAALFGENKIKIKSGETSHQVYRLFGENKIDTRGLASTTASARIYGEGQLRLNATDEVHVNAFGEPTVDVTGNANVNKGIVIGRLSIERAN